MVSPNPTTKKAPSIAELTARYLERRSDSETLLGSELPFGEVSPFEAIVGFRVEPRQAWTDALAALGTFSPAVRPNAVTPPSEWSGVVAAADSDAALPFCVGNYPQRVRDLGALLQPERLSRLRPTPEQVASLAAPAGLRSWAEEAVRNNQYPAALAALGALRRVGALAHAEAILGRLRAGVPAEWAAALANEEAALLWHQGRCGEAARLWDAQDESVAVLFNRGLAALFGDRPAEARKWFSRAVDGLPDSSTWHHLGRLYLSLAEMRR